VSQHPEPAQPPAGLDIAHRVVGGTLVVAVAGEIDLDTAPALHAAVTAAIRQTAGEPCILDLTAVTFLGSAGLTALLDATRVSEARREPLRIVVDSNRPVIRPIAITGLDDVLSLYHTIEEALAAEKL
jgi:anti-sigma B factor antagonist